MRLEEDWRWIVGSNDDAEKNAIMLAMLYR
jgi:hypothetical protein